MLSWLVTWVSTSTTCSLTKRNRLVYSTCTGKPAPLHALCLQSFASQSGFHCSGWITTSSASPDFPWEISFAPRLHSSPPCTGFQPRNVIELPQLALDD